jgi:hypothetical protein
MKTSQFFPLGKGLELTQIEQHADQLVLHYTSSAAVCLFMQHPDNLNEGQQVGFARPIQLWRRPIT